MRIAYISCEFADNKWSGGIGTYIYQAASMMHNRGHEVEVFCAADHEAKIEIKDGIVINRVFCNRRTEFPQKVKLPFIQRHTLKNFDVMESPEYLADGLYIKLAHPEIPLVVKLHTPDFLANHFNNYYSRAGKVKYAVKSKIRRLLSGRDSERLITKRADRVISPSVSLARIVAKKWHLNFKDIAIVPNPYCPSEDLLEIEAGVSKALTITYLGRLEVRKGVLALCQALICLLTEFPNLKIQFVGKDTPRSPMPFTSMKQYLQIKLKKHLHNIEFLEVKSHQVADVLRNSAICIFPSIWENFPSVCLEAMAAGRPIIASKAGGMNEILDDQSGILIDPLDIAEIRLALTKLITNNDLRLHLGRKARERLLKAYNQDQIGGLLEQNYALAIQANNQRFNQA